MRPSASASTCTLLLLTAAIAACLPAGGQAPPPASNLQIVELLADPDTAVGQREFVEILNPTDHAVALAGWKLRDQPTASGSTNTFTFPAWSLPAMARVVVWGGGAADSRGPAWSNSAVWNNAGDGATLSDAAGNAVDWFGYGTATPPATFANKTVPAAPAKGQSLQWSAGKWTTAAPTPGLAVGESGGSLVVDITNVPPTAAFVGLPAAVAPAGPAILSLLLADGNGAEDIVAWQLRSGDGTLASGTTGGAQTVTLSGPPQAGRWNLTLTVTDRAGLMGSAQASIVVRLGDLLVDMPDGPLHFSATPGQTAAAAVGSLRLRNQGTAVVTPLLDVSSFTGPGGVAFPAEGHVDVGIGLANTTWLPYTGPLTSLPPVAPGAEMPLLFRLHDVPGGLAAGPYGASFSVVPR